MWFFPDNVVSEATLIDNDTVKIKKILGDRSEAYIEDSPEKTIIKLRNRSDNKNIDIIKYKGKLPCKEEVIVDGHTMKLDREHHVIEADLIFEPVINKHNTLNGGFYDEYIGEAGDVYCDYRQEIENVKSLFARKNLMANA